MRRRGKYNNVKTVVDGMRFDSRKEAGRYVALKLMQKHRLIADLETQPEFPLVVNGRKIGKYIADFRYFDHELGVTVVEDVKGVRTAVYRLKKKLVLALYGVDVQEV
jgi:hypothetical protein